MSSIATVPALPKRWRKAKPVIETTIATLNAEIASLKAHNQTQSEIINLQKKEMRQHQLRHHSGVDIDHDTRWIVPLEFDPRTGRAAVKAVGFDLGTSIESDGRRFLTRTEPDAYDLEIKIISHEQWEARKEDLRT